MANPSPVQSEAFREAARANQFRPGNREQQKGRPWSIRSMLRYHGGSTEEPTEEMLKRMTPAQRIAIKLLKRAEEGDVRAIQFVINRIDGKVVQPNLNAEYARIQSLTDDQLNDEIARIEVELARFQI